MILLSDDGIIKVVILNDLNKGERKVDNKELAEISWDEIVSELRQRAIQYKTIKQIAYEVQIESQTLKKVLQTGHKPLFFSQLKIRQWLKETKTTKRIKAS